MMLSHQLAMTDQSTQDATKGLILIERLNKELVFVRGSLKKHIQKQDRDHEFHAGRHRSDLQKYLAEDQANIRGLQAKVTALQAQLRTADARQDVRHQLRLNVDQIMNFLNANSQPNLQWPRLRSLLGHCRDNTRVSTSWKTTISIMAADDPSVSTAAYIPVQRPDEDGDEESKDGGFTRGHPRESQEYPSEWIRESNDPCRPDGDILLRDVDAAREMLNLFPVIWSNLRLDIRALILYGVNYEGALEWLGEDRPVHSCFHQGPLLKMLLRMMFWNELDGTSWTKYVPRRYFVVARAKLDSLLENDDHPDLWGPLVPVVEDVLDEETQTPERGDPTDQNWTNDADDAGNDDDDYDDPMVESPSKSTCAKTKRGRIAPAEAKTPAKRQHQRKTCAALAIKSI
ncbi:hypothetical protein PHMEG_00025021 [Phytophthora megakarya]|uniref:Uncharacterized protein n=1 Tax=Phytophthora megakarya TaxID=4795 RepID=A0A225VD81_9STRA|nr:hypothetical protein PHMEG_00025021 [Phytophthora megakarya]